MARQGWLDVGTLIESDLFELLGLNELPEEQQDELRLMVMESIRDRMLLRIADQLGEQKKDAWLALLDRDAPTEEIEGYLTQNGIDLQALAADEALRYKFELAQRLGIVKPQATSPTSNEPSTQKE